MHHILERKHEALHQLFVGVEIYTGERIRKMWEMVAEEHCEMSEEFMQLKVYTSVCAIMFRCIIVFKSFPIVYQ